MSTSTSPAPAPAVSTEFGLLAWLENTRVTLPLKGVEARFEVAGDVAHVEMDQIYHQTADRPLDCTYVFPLPGDAAVHRCEFHVNGRVIVARIEELQQARDLYDKAKQAGQRAALVESQRPNLFTLNLANVQPQDLIVVRLGYVQPLERVGEERRLRIPSCPGIRYIPGQPLLRPNLGPGTSDDTDRVPDASRISPPRIDAFHPEAAYLSVAGTLRTQSGDFDSITTASHRLSTQVTADAVEIQLETEGAVPDQDFLVGWTLRAATELTSRAWSSTRGDSQYLLVELRAPAGATAEPREPLDVYFLLDRSSSMDGPKWTQACKALEKLMGQLDTTDRIHVTTFDSVFRALESDPLPTAKFQSRWPSNRILALGTGGGTDMLPALEAVCMWVRMEGTERKPVLVLLTDGQVGNEAEITAALRRHPRLVLHAIGIDTVVNDALLTSVARQQRGQCVLLRPDEDIPAALQRLGRLMTRPVITDLQCPAGWETSDGPLPDLYAGQTGTALLRGPRTETFTLSGRRSSGQSIQIPLRTLDPQSPVVPLLWARRRILDLESRSRIADCVPLAKEFNLLCQGTAFVAWDEQQQVPVASERRVQPSLEPAGWNLGSQKSSRIRRLQESTVPAALRPDRRGYRQMNGVRADSGYPASFSAFGQKGDGMSLSLNSEESSILETFADILGVGSEAAARSLAGILTDWLDSMPPRARALAELRLEQLAHEIRSSIKGTEVVRLREFVRRLPDLFGQHSPFLNSLEVFRRFHGW